MSKTRSAAGFGPAHAFAFIMDADLRKWRLRDKVKLTLATAEPQIGNLGFAGARGSKGISENEFRHHHVNRVCNAKVAKIEA